MTIPLPPPFDCLRRCFSRAERGTPARPRFGFGNSLLASGKCLLLGALLGFGSPAGQAQWATQVVELKAGWTAVYLQVDASYATLDELIGGDPANPIQEIWLWQPAPGTHQFIDSPQLPTGSSSQWASWNRSLGGSSELHRLQANAGYLVRIDDAVATYQWNLKGHPAPPAYDWRTSGLNFLGFPTPTVDPPSFESFLSREPALLQNAEIYRYVGGALGAGNPQRLYALRTTPVVRGQAFWLRAGDLYNRYYGPFEIELQSSDGAHFNTAMGQYRFRLRNLVASEIQVTFTLLASEAAPTGQANIAGTPPLLLRGDLDLTTLTYAYAGLNAQARSMTLAPRGQAGSDIEVVLGLNRTALSGNPGDLFAGILRLTDSLGLAQVDVPVSAVVASRAGLWIGDASVSQVRHYLRTYARDGEGAPLSNPDGSYQVAQEDTTLGEVLRPFPLRLILHHDEASGDVVLLQRVYYGLGAQGAGTILATQEQALDPAQLGGARRISASHLPWSEANVPWPCTGVFAEGGDLAATIAVNENDHATNPFLHTYHPDHDNLDARFEQVLPRGEESFSITREIQLSFAPPADDFVSLTLSGEALQGDYAETIRFGGQGSETRTFETRGRFLLNRVSELGTLVHH